MKPIYYISTLLIAIAAMIYYYIKVKTYCIFFNKSNFDSPDEPGSHINMQNDTLDKLCRAREIAKTSFIINSGYRTIQHNIDVGGVQNSAHTKGWAIDIATTPAKQQIIYNALKIAGFRRFGIYGTFIHADNDPTKQSPSVWGDNPNQITL